MPTFLGDPDDPNSEVKIAMIDMNLQLHRMAMGVSIQVKDPQEIERIKQREMELTKEKILKILKTGAKVVLTTKGVDDLCMNYFVEAGVLCARRVPKEDLKRLAKATGGQVIITMADMEGEESFDPEALGRCRAVQETSFSRFLDAKDPELRQLSYAEPMNTCWTRLIVPFMTRCVLSNACSNPTRWYQVEGLSRQPSMCICKNMPCKHWTIESNCLLKLLQMPCW
jgi:hypothetical protein